MEEHGVSLAAIDRGTATTDPPFLTYAAKAGVGILAFKTTAGGDGDKNRTRPFDSDAAPEWVLQNPHISTIISGLSSLEEMRKNLEMITDPKMSDTWEAKRQSQFVRVRSVAVRRRSE